MFTGIVEELGSVESMERRGEGAQLRIACKTVLSDAFPGASIAVTIRRRSNGTKVSVSKLSCGR